MIVVEKYPHKCRWCDEVFDVSEGDLFAKHVMSEHQAQFLVVDDPTDTPTDPTVMMVRRPPVPLGEMEPLYPSRVKGDWSWLPMFLICVLVIFAITIILRTL